MIDEEVRLLASGLEKNYKEYRGWVFANEWPGFFVYYKNPYAIYFTPDFSQRGFVSIQINFEDEPDRRFEGAEKPFQPRTAERLFEIVRPFLDAIDGRASVLEWEP